MLFLELACIRWFPSHVLFLTFFTNTVLLACFVGMSVGCLVARRPRPVPHPLHPLLARRRASPPGCSIDQYSDALMQIFAVGNQANPDVVYFGTEAASSRRTLAVPRCRSRWSAALFFVLIAAVMVGPGQEMGRAFNRVPNRTAAYSANLLGSLVGIGMFAACSYLRLPPVVWFGARRGGHRRTCCSALTGRRTPTAAARTAVAGRAMPRPCRLVCLGADGGA